MIPLSWILFGTCIGITVTLAIICFKLRNSLMGVRQKIGIFAHTAQRWAGGSMDDPVNLSEESDIREIAAAFKVMKDRLRDSNDFMRSSEQRMRELHEQVSTLQFMESIAVAANISTNGAQAVQAILHLVCNNMG